VFICDLGEFIFEEQQSEEGIYQSAEDYNLYETVEGEFDMSETRYGFTKMSVNEFKKWIQKQGNYNYTGIQIHHTAAPSYENFYKANGTHEDELTRQNNMKSYHVNTNGWDDIAQHFTIFPNGKIVTGRSLANTTAIGIRGWNYNKICIEIYGNFDKGKDVMTEEQKQAVIAVYGELCKKFGITPSISTIRCHAWFTAGGTYLGDYVAGRSAKTCPGTNFMGFGNSKAAIEKYFIPLVKDYINGTTSNIPTQIPTTVSGNYVVKVTSDTLNVRKGPGVSYGVCGELGRGEAYTIVQTQNGWGKLKSGVGWINLSYTQKVSNSTTASATVSTSQYLVKVTANNLNVRKGPGASYDISATVKKGDVFTITQTKNGWGKLKSGVGWISLGYTEKLK
jgi:SH3-like domain-containing protein